MIFDRNIKSVQRLIKKYGQLVTWTKNVRVPDGQQPWKVTQTPQTFQVYIVFTKKGSNFAEALQHLLKGTEVNIGSPRGLMASVPFVPDITDNILRGNQRIVIKGIDPIEPNGVPIMYLIEFA